MLHEPKEINQRPFRIQQGNLISFDLFSESPCSCEGGLPVKLCCLTPQGFTTKPAVTSPPGVKTGSSHNGCYAITLNDCSRKLSKEHYLSKNILKRLNKKEQGGLRVGGFPWQKGEGSQPIPPQALTARILCTRHNSALWKLDSMAERLFNAFDNIAENTRNMLCLFNGHDIERWLLKVLCGVIASKNAKFDRLVLLELPEKCVEVLFGIKGFESGAGLYVCNSMETIFTGPRGVVLSPVGQKDRIVGVRLWICGFELILFMEPPDGGQIFGRQVAYRPAEFHITGPQYEKSIVLCWDEPADKATIHLQLIDDKTSALKMPPTT